jgi:prepilin-type processing-associated H-X9-DG protein
VYHKNNAPARSVKIWEQWCPSSAIPATGPFGYPSSYAGVHHDRAALIDKSNNGVFFLNSRVTRRDVTDGLRHTLFIGEQRTDINTDLSWMSGTYSTLANMGQPLNTESQAGAGGTPVTPLDLDPMAGADGSFEVDDDPALLVGAGATGFGSYHVSGVNFAFGDGHVRHMHLTTDIDLLRNLANRHDGNLTAIEPD